MHIKRYLLVIALLVTLGSVADKPPSARMDGIWTAWLYNADTHELIQIFLDGTPAASQVLPNPLGPWSTTISRDGNLLANCHVDEENNTMVRVYDLVQQRYLSSYDVGFVERCGLSYYSFSEDGSQLAFGLAGRNSSEDDQVDPFQLVVIDTATGDPLYEYNDLGWHLPLVNTFHMVSEFFSWRDFLYADSMGDRRAM